jgi:peroxiredoxin
VRFRGAAAAAVVVAAVLLTAGCASNDDLSGQYRNGDTKNYISGNGAVSEFDARDTTEALNFTATTIDGKTVSAKDYRGKVLVLNFWFALCGPCRSEAKDLNSISAAKKDTATFLGVNVRDEAGTARSFIRNFDVPYTNVLDAKGSTVQLAFSGAAAPNATPSTIVVDRNGHVSARILGTANKSVLSTLIDDASNR